jgi:hypothetical protein
VLETAGLAGLLGAADGLDAFATVTPPTAAPIAAVAAAQIKIRVFMV